MKKLFSRKAILTLRIFNALTFIGFVLFGLLFIFSPEIFPRTYERPQFIGWFALLWAGVLVLPTLFFRIPKKHAKNTARQARIILQSGVAFGIILNGLGRLGLYDLHKIGFQYDKLAHFLAPLVLVITFSIFVEHWYGLSTQKIIFAVAAIVLVGSFLWEVAEWLTDILFETTTLGVEGQQITLDTSWDVFWDIAGIAIGMWLYRSHSE